MSRLVTFVMAALLAAPCVAQSPEAPGTSVYPVVTGSVPPVEGLFTCTEDLKKLPYREDITQACLHTLLATGYFDGGTVRVEKTYDGRPLTSFLLRAPDLKVTALDFGLDTKTEGEIRQYLDKANTTLHLGRPFRIEDELVTSSGLRYFFSDKGLAVGVSARIVFNYPRGEVEVHYAIVPGPAIPQVTAPPPFGPGCAQWIGTLNWLDADDSVPLPALERLTGLGGGYICLSEGKLQEYEHKIEESGLVAECKVEILGPPTHPDVSLHLVGRPLVLDSIQLEGFGEARDRIPANGLSSLKPGDLYSRSRVAAALETFQVRPSAPTGVTEVFEDVRTVGQGKISLKLQVLTINGNQVTVLGKASGPNVSK